MQVKKIDFIEFMLQSGALLFGDFTLKSGRQSPYFINAGEFFKDGEQLLKLSEFYTNMIRGTDVNFKVLFGPAYKGIPLASVVALKLAENGTTYKVSYDRKERKDHGEVGMIMGYTPKDGDKIAIIEDVTAAGTSVREVISLLENSGIDAKVVALYISIDRMEKGTGDIAATEQIKRDYGIEVYSIATTTDIIDYLENTPEDCTKIPNSEMHAAKMREYLAKYGALN
ncbi:MAG: orotate phosphoribosyltransferase [Oscillospiraceae bacterium]|nr:orotate phosphoribosyltransferase [Oscillospiraceae bacterium]